MKIDFTKDPLRKGTWCTDIWNASVIYWIVEEELKKQFPNAITAIYSNEKEPDFFRLMVKFLNDADEAEFILKNGNFDI